MNAYPLAPDRPTAFRIECGPSDAGWASFALTLDGRVFETIASSLGGHPLSVLVPLVVELHEHYTAEPWIDGATDAEVDEPGGLRLGFFPPEYPLVRVRVWEAVDLLAGGALGELLGEHVVGFETIAREVHREAGRVLGRQGLVGYRVGWLGYGRWDSDGPQSDVFPLDHYLYLTRLLQHGLGTPVVGGSLGWEVAELQRLLDLHGG